MSGLALLRSFGVRPVTPSGGGGGGGETTLGGAHSTSTSLIDYPKTGPVTSGDWYVDPNAATNGVGTFADPFDNLASARSAVSDGQTILVREGVLTPSSRFICSTAWATGIKIFGYGTERFTLDGSSLGTGSASRMITVSAGAANEHWKGFEIINCDEAPMIVEGDFHFEDFHVHHNGINDAGSGAVRIINGADGVILQDFAIWRNGDGVSNSTNSPDCVQCTTFDGSVTQNHKLVRGFMAHGADDNCDLFRAANVEAIDCVSYKAGYYYNGNAGSTSSGDGNGFKLGGADYAGIGNNTLKGSLSIQSRIANVNVNSAPQPCTLLNNTADTCGGYGWNSFTDPATVVKNNISTNGSPDWDNSGVAGSYNTWNSPVVTDAQFEDTVAYDYSLGSGSPCIGAGEGGVNQGASDVALEIAKEWLAKDLTT